MSLKLRLRVEEARQIDFGRCIVRIDVKSMEELGVSSGDTVLITGSKQIGAIVMPAYRSDEGKGIIRMDGLLRKNAGVSIGDYVTVEKAFFKEARKIVFAPARKDIQIVPTAETAEILKENLLNRPVKTGDIVSTTASVSTRTHSDFDSIFDSFFGIREVSFGLGEVRFVVVDTIPKGIVRIGFETEVEILPKAPETIKEAPRVTYEDIGGLKEAIQRIREMVELPLKHPELFDRLGIEPPKGVLLYGPPGCGKTLLAKAVANESDANFYAINGPEIMSKFYGESEKKLRDIFDEARKNAPSIIFIDEVDSIAPKREEVSGEVERRVVSQLLTLMDGLETRGKVVVIAATNRPNAIDPALRRPGRFDREIEIGPPDKQARKEILQIHTRGMPLADDVDLDEIAVKTHGFVGADLAALCKEAAMYALRRILPEIDLNKPVPKEILSELKVRKEDFEYALKIVNPSAMREVMVEMPKVRWNDIGGLEEVKRELREAIELPLKHPEVFRKFGMEPPKGVLLFGPPGCGKTLLAKAVATEAEANFISIRGPELLSKWVGESERAVREIFRKAKIVSPCIIFFDEIDSLFPRRDIYTGTHVMQSLVNQLLTEMDGIQELKDVFVLAATNRPDLLDPALLRPGRFDKLVYIPPPDFKARLEIFKIYTRNMPLGDNVNLEELARRTEGYSGADIKAVCREAVMAVIRENIDAERVEMKHFEEALRKVKPSLTIETIKKYEEIAEKMKELI